MSDRTPIDAAPVPEGWAQPDLSEAELAARVRELSGGRTDFDPIGHQE